MWEKISGLFKILWDAGQQAQDNSRAIRELGESHQQLVRAVEYLYAQNERLSDALQHERELRERDERVRQAELNQLKTELKLQISEELRRLPPYDNS